MSRRSLIFFVILLILGFATRFAFFGYPHQVVFDEIHYGQDASYYMTGNYFFDVHPPLGKILIAMTGEVGGYTPSFTFEKVGMEYPDNSYMTLRLLPMILGSLLPALIFLICVELG